jgi:hypothetical protein
VSCPFFANSTREYQNSHPAFAQRVADLAVSVIVFCLDSDLIE